MPYLKYPWNKLRNDLPQPSFNLDFTPKKTRAGSGREVPCSIGCLTVRLHRGDHPTLTTREKGLGSDGPTRSTSGGRELRKSRRGRRPAREAPRVRAQVGGSGWGGTTSRSTQRDFPSPSRRWSRGAPRRGRAARPAPARRWASNSEARGASAERCPVTGPDSAKSRRGGSSLAAPAAASLTGRSDHGCAPHSPARSLAAPAAPCICQLRARSLRRASWLPPVPCSSQSPPQAAGSLLTQDPARPGAARDAACRPARILPPVPVSPRAAAAAPPRAGWGCTESSMLFSNPPRGHSSRGDRNPRPHLESGFRIATPRKRTPPPHRHPPLLKKGG